MAEVEETPPQAEIGQKGKYFRVDVQDTGEGMNPEQLAQIFEPFFTTKPPGAGTGMGLSIAHGIVQEYQGWITVDSTPTAGTCFSVYLPKLSGR